MKSKTSLFLVLLLVSCHKQSGSENIATTKLIFDAFNEHDWQSMLRYYADHAVFEDPAFSKPVRDKDLIAAHHKELQAYVPDIQDTIRAIYASGDGEHVIVEFVSTGTTVEGENFALSICTVLSFKHGKVVRDATFYDNR